MQRTNYFRKKPLSAYESDIQNSQLTRTPGKWELTALGVGAVIGGGIFAW